MHENRDFKEIFVKRLTVLYDELADKKGNYPYNRVKYAKFLGVTHNQISGWLDNRSEPSINLLGQIANRHNVSIDWLIGRSTIRNPNLAVDEALALQIQQLKPSTHKAITDLLDSLT